MDRRGNEGSGTLEIRWRDQLLILSGDAEGEGLATMLDEGWLRGSARLLLYPHHGSETPFLGPLLGRLTPAEVWISSGTPPAVAAELDRRGVAWRGTARDGALSLTLP